MRFVEIHTAHEWHITPTEFYKLSPEDRSYMIAYTNTMSRMQTWESDERERESAIRNRPRGKRF